MKKVAIIINIILFHIQLTNLMIDFLITTGYIQLTNQKYMQDVYMFICICIGCLIVFGINIIISLLLKKFNIKAPIKYFNIANIIILFISLLILSIPILF